MAELTFWQFPVSLILALVFVAGIFIIWKYLPEGRLRKCLSGRGLGIIAMAVICILTAVEGTTGWPLHRNPVFWAFAILMMLSLGFAVLDRARSGKDLAGKISHLGMFLLIFGAFWGAPDVVDVQMAATGQPEHIAYSRNGKAVTLPFDVALEEFRTEYYEDGASPKQYISTIVLSDSEKTRTTSVNHPCLHKGWFIYQSDFDHENGAYSVLKLVRDPWLPLICLGLLLLVAGAFIGMRMDWKSRLVWPALGILAILFTILSVARINFGTLMPALRSVWFIPHLAMYMLAYSALALALMSAVPAVCGVHPEKLNPLTDKLFSTASSLLLVGMACGAIWAKLAWGDWWTWDAKECWAAVTWLLTLCGTHLPATMRNKKMNISVVTLIFIILAFLAMQVAWYGVEWLPAAQTSMHAYK